MAEGPDYDEAKQIFEKTMKEALAHLDQVSAEVSRAKEQAIEQELAAKEELKRIQRDAERLSEEFINQHRKEYDQRVRNDTLMEVTEKLLSMGRSSDELKLWLNISPVMIARAHSYLGFEMLNGRAANVLYEYLALAGNVFFNWDGHVLKFPYKFGDGQANAVIDIPDQDHWAENTGLRPDDRNGVLEFIAHRFVRDQAPNHKYFINADHILIV